MSLSLCSTFSGWFSYSVSESRLFWCFWPNILNSNPSKKGSHNKQTNKQTDLIRQIPASSSVCYEHKREKCVCVCVDLMYGHYLVNHSEEPLFSVLPGHGGAIIGAAVAAVIVVTAGLLIGVVVFLIKGKKRSECQIPSFLIFSHFRD